MKLKKYEIIAAFDDDLECGLEYGLERGYDLGNLYIVQKDFDVTELSAEFRKSHTMDSSDWSLFDQFYKYLAGRGFVKEISSYVSCKPWRRQKKGSLRLQIQRCDELENISLWNAIAKFDEEGFIV